MQGWRMGGMNVLIPCFTVAYLVSAVLGDCVPPVTMPLHTSEVLPPKADYDKGDTITYSCDGEETGYFGTVFIKCEEPSTGTFQWSNYSRECDAPYPIEAGSIAGIVMASFNVMVVVMAILITKVCLTGGDGQEEQ